MKQEVIDTSPFGWFKSFMYVVAVYVGNALTYINVDHALFIGLSVMMALDWLTGVWKAGSLGIKVTSKRSNRGVLEKSVLLLIPLSIAFVAKVINIPLGVTIKTMFSILTLAELYSVIGNCYCIYTKQDHKEYDAVTAVLKYLRDLVRKPLSKFLEDPKEE